MDSDQTPMATISLTSLVTIKESGFLGFRTTAHLIESRCAEITRAPGVYLVLRERNAPPRFLGRSPAGHFKGKDPTESLATLRENWVPNTPVLYIGKASSLRRRLREYMRYGDGEPVGHQGGRLIWQLEDSRELLVCWREQPAPRETEKALIARFKREHGSRPFANLTG